MIDPEQVSFENGVLLLAIGSIADTWSTWYALNRRKGLREANRGARAIIERFGGGWPVIRLGVAGLTFVGFSVTQNPLGPITMAGIGIALCAVSLSNMWHIARAKK